eukprot:TRINITY_DN56082_c0_g1_i1.p1 TRINITY_DN56082_c0_g1~~TRINITY_DN56082_c0_g1_i1.p1  ORF type:complete len:209 (+),score=57.93 TRINITY_DN56082_c0_g1_i1:76-627(+)
MAEVAAALGATKTGVELASRVFADSAGLRAEHFGTPGFPNDEHLCPNFQVFMRMIGRTTMEQRRELMPKGTTARQAKERFERAHGGHLPGNMLLKDENGFILSDELADAPLSSLSNRCRVGLTFSPLSGNLVLGTVGDIGKGVTDTAVGLGKGVADTAAGVGRGVTGYFFGGGGPKEGGAADA